MSDFDSSPSSQVSIEVKLLLQLQCLVSSVRLSPTFPLCIIKTTVEQTNGSRAEQRGEKMTFFSLQRKCTSVSRDTRREKDLSLSRNGREYCHTHNEWLCSSFRRKQHQEMRQEIESIMRWAGRGRDTWSEFQIPLNCTASLTLDLRQYRTLHSLAFASLSCETLHRFYESKWKSMHP